MCTILFFFLIDDILIILICHLFTPLFLPSPHCPILPSMYQLSKWLEQGQQSKFFSAFLFNLCAHNLDSCHDSTRQKHLSALLHTEYVPSLYLTECPSSYTEQIKSSRKSDTGFLSLSIPAQRVRKKTCRIWIVFHFSKQTKKETN